MAAARKERLVQNQYATEIIFAQAISRFSALSWSAGEVHWNNSLDFI